MKGSQSSESFGTTADVKKGGVVVDPDYLKFLIEKANRVDEHQISSRQVAPLPSRGQADFSRGHSNGEMAATPQFPRSPNSDQFERSSGYHPGYPAGNFGQFRQTPQSPYSAYQPNSFTQPSNPFSFGAQFSGDPVFNVHYHNHFGDPNASSKVVCGRCRTIISGTPSHCPNPGCNTPL